MPESRGGIDGTLYLSDNIPLMHFTVTLLHTVWLSEILLTKPVKIDHTPARTVQNADYIYGI